MFELTENEFMECEEAERRKHDEKVRELENENKYFLAGYEQGIGRLRYCCTCKKWKECKTGPYGICADWEIKED